MQTSDAKLYTMAGMSKEAYQWVLGRQEEAGELWAHLAILRQALERIVPDGVDVEAPGHCTWGNAWSAALSVARMIEGMAADHVSGLDPGLASEG